MIVRRYAATPGIERMRKIANNTRDGAQLYHDFLDVHEKAYPQYMAELRGLAAGAGVSFASVFLQNIEQEFSMCAAQLVAEELPSDDTRAVDGCSDVMMCGEGANSVCAVAHNEDNGKQDRGTLILVTARLREAAERAPGEWVAATYAGDLPSGAFGFSRSGGFGFTLNWVGPTDVECPGLGRGFVSRALLDAPSFDAALALVTRARMAAGHNYQLYRTAEPAAIVNVEVAPRGLAAVHPIGRDPFFHANQYTTLAVPQILGNSSAHRLARAHAMLAAHAPRSTAQLRDVTGDQTDASWPIFHDERSHAAGDLSDWTITSILVDLRKKTLRVYKGNPKDDDVEVEVPLR